MKKICIVLLVICFSLAVTPTVYAEDWMYTPAREIESVFPQGNDTTGSFVFILKGTQIPSSTSCTNRFVISQDHAVYDELVAAVLLAHALGNEVLVYYDDDSTDCNAPAQRVRVYGP